MLRGGIVRRINRNLSKYLVHFSYTRFNLILNRLTVVCFHLAILNIFFGFFLFLLLFLLASSALTSILRQIFLCIVVLLIWFRILFFTHFAIDIIIFFVQQIKRIDDCRFLLFLLSRFLGLWDFFCCRRFFIIAQFLYQFRDHYVTVSFQFSQSSRGHLYFRPEARKGFWKLRPVSAGLKYVSPHETKMSSMSFRVFTNLTHRSGLLSTYSLCRNLLQHPLLNNVVVTRGKKTRSSTRGDRLLQKMMVKGAGGKRKKQWIDFPASSDFLGKTGPNTGSQRRAVVLSAVLHEHISGMVDSGEIDQRLVLLGLEISQVKVSDYCNSVSVHWVTSGTPRDDEIEALLPDASHKIRLQLSMLRVMGNVPPINFVKDRKKALQNEVDYLLSIADMGPEPELTAEDDGDEQTTDPAAERPGQLTAKTKDPANPQHGAINNHNFSKAANNYHQGNQPNKAVHDNLALHGITMATAPSFPDIGLRTDILQLSRENMVKEILHKKQKAQDRSYVGDNTSDLKLTFSKDHVKFKDITKMLEKKKKSKQMSRHEKRELMDSMNCVDWREEQATRNKLNEDYYDQNYETEK